MKQVKKLWRKALASLLAGTMMVSACPGAFAGLVFGPQLPAAVAEKKTIPSLSAVTEIQAYTDQTIYGTGLVEVEITYREDVDLSGITADSYLLEDRGSLNPDFGRIGVEEVTVEGNVVTLEISGASAATEENDLVYTGDDEEGSRQRNAFGVYCTGPWYRDGDGVIHYGADDTDAYENNTIGMGCQARACLELKLSHVGVEEAPACLADELGRYNEDGLWSETVDRQFGEDGFRDLSALEIPSTAAFAQDGTADLYVRGYYYIPEDYDPADGIVFTLQGQESSYWQLEDGTNNAGAGFMYDSATASWADKGAIVVNIHNRSSAGGGEYWNAYDFVLDDVRVMKYFIEEYQITGNIVLQGSAWGTMASALIIKALAGQPYNPRNQVEGVSEPEEYTLNREKFNFTVDTYICQNGSFGYGYDQEDWAAVAATGLKVWAFDGEQDTNNIAPIAAYTEIMTGVESAQWAKENIRLTGLTSQLFYPWGESDHSVARINGWYFSDAAYCGPDLEVDGDGRIVYNTKLTDGDKYVLEGRGSAASDGKAGYEYTVYDDLFQLWALGIEAGEDENGGNTGDGGQGDDVTGGETGDGGQDDGTTGGETGNEDGGVEDDGSVVKLPALVYAELEELMAEQSAKYLTADNVAPMLWQGLLEMDIKVGEAVRTAKLYVPSGSPQGSMFVVMNVPEGQDTLTFMKESGWMAKARDEDFCLFVLEPAQGTAWGEAAQEAPYVSAAVGAAHSGKWLQPGPSMYMVGYGAIGTELHKYAMENPLTIAGAVFMDASAIDGGFLQENGERSFDTATKTYGVTRKEVPAPVMILDGDMDEATVGALAYWQAAAAHEKAVERFAPEGEEILIAAVVGEQKTVDYTAPETTAAAWAFLDRFYRHGSGVLSNTISWKVDYEEMGVEFRSFTDSNGILRQYLVYIPEEYRDSEDLPVVVAYHGASASMRNFFENTLWYNIADREGIMLVFPESTLLPVPTAQGGGERSPTAYRPLWQVEDPELKPTDVVYANELLDHILASYAQADESRIYCTGHAMGGMMTHYLGSDGVSHRFAAMGTTSGPLMAREETGSQAVPMFMTMAEYDMWSYDLNLETVTTRTVDMWLIRSGIATAENAAEIRKTGANRAFVQGRYHHYIWEDGEGTPLFRYAWVAQKDHVNIPAENELLWNQWFSRWTLSGDGIRTYNNPLAEQDCIDLDSIEELEIDWSQASQLPLTGYFSKELESGRSVKVYIAGEASIRSYFTIVAVPDGVETWDFLEKNGWIDLANAKGEGLFVLEPGPGGWGEPGNEEEYVLEAVSFLKSGKNSEDITVFSTFGEFYIAAYGASTPAVELWAARNPLFVISQVYVDGISAGEDALSEAGELAYGPNSVGGDDPMPNFEAMLEQSGMFQITSGEVPVPTWLAGGDMADSQIHWMLANECLVEAVDGVHHQSIDAVAYQTAYANSQLPEDAPYGISQVKVTEDTMVGAWEIYDFLSTWTRYDNTFAYSNALAYRLDYTAARVGAQLQAGEGEVLSTYTGPDHNGQSQTVALLGQESVLVDGHGTVEVGVIAFSDNNGDGENDPREYLVYVPRGFEKKELPVLFVYPGESQTAGIFFDCTQWYQVADREGIVLVFVNETYSSPTNITHVDSMDYQTAMMTLLREDTDGKFHEAALDFSRVYGTGQSLGSMTTQGFARSNPEFFAAVAATSGVKDMGQEDSNDPIPTFLMMGRGELGFMVPDLKTASNLIDWGGYFMWVNGLRVWIDTPENGFGSDEQQFLENRYQINIWENDQDIPVLGYAHTLMRDHDCYPGEMVHIWDFLEHYRMDEDGVRYYSESAFAEDDQEKIQWNEPEDLPDPDEPDPEEPDPEEPDPEKPAKPTKPTKPSSRPIFPVQWPFIDVTEHDWFYEAVKYAYENGFMVGISENRFGPGISTTRGMVVTILWAMEGKPAAEGKQFADVAADAYYADAILWAAQKGIVSGYGDGTFGPDQSITREQIVTILRAYGTYKGWDTAVTENRVEQFADWATASPWALDSLNWATSKGLMAGRGNRVLAPTETTTRAETAQFLKTMKVIFAP